MSFLLADLAVGRPLALGRAVLGCTFVIGVAMLCAPRARWLSVVGTASMAIYVMHTIFSAAIRIGARSIGFSHDGVTLIVGTIGGLVFPFVIWLIARHYGVLPQLGLGAQPRRRQEVQP